MVIALVCRPGVLYSVMITSTSSIHNRYILWKDQSKYSDTCNTMFISDKCFQNNLTLRVKGNLVCQWRQACRNSESFVTLDSKHECFQKFRNYRNKKQPSGHFCYVAPLKSSKLSNTFMYFSSIRNARKILKSVLDP
jgi:hypothetical protein